MDVNKGDKVIIPCKYDSIRILDIKMKSSNDYYFDDSNIENDYYKNGQPYILLLKNKNKVGLATFEDGVTIPCEYSCVEIVDNAFYSKNWHDDNKWNFNIEVFHDRYFNNDKPFLVFLYSKKRKGIRITSIDNSFHINLIQDRYGMNRILHTFDESLKYKKLFLFMNGKPSNNDDSIDYNAIVPSYIDDAVTIPSPIMRSYSPFVIIRNESGHKFGLCCNGKIVTDKIYENYYQTYRTFHNMSPFILLKKYNEDKYDLFSSSGEKLTLPLFDDVRKYLMNSTMHS